MKAPLALELLSAWCEARAREVDLRSKGKIGRPPEDEGEIVGLRAAAQKIREVAQDVTA